MATMVPRGSTPVASPSSTPEETSKNQQKICAEPPTTGPNSVSHLGETDLPDYQPFPLEDPGTCDVCHNHVCGLTGDFIPDEFRDVDWSNMTETQLEEMVLNNLDTTFRAAIKTIVSCGFSKEAATSAVFRPEIFNGCKDTVTNVVENALAFLRTRQVLDFSVGQSSAEEMKKLERSVLAEIINVLCKMQPSFSVGNAMWSLLISDINVTHACAMDCNALNSKSEMTSTGCIAPRAEQEFSSSNSSSQTIPEVNVLRSTKPNAMLPPQSSPSLAEMPAVVGLSNPPSLTFSPSNNLKDSSSSADLPKEKIAMELSSSFSLSSQREVKPSGGKKGPLSSSKRETLLRQISARLEKSSTTLGPKAALKAGKHGIGGLLLDRKNKLVSQKIIIKNTIKVFDMESGSKTPHADPSLNVQFSPLSLQPPSSSPPPVPDANTDLSLSLGSCGIKGSSPIDKICEIGVPHNEKGMLMFRLILRARELQLLLQDWTDWGQQKVMQAARRLSKDKPELQSLRQEKEEVDKLKKETQMLEENNRKMLAEMEIALSRATSQVEATNVAARRLHVQNSELRKETEAAKLKAAVAAVGCQEISNRETKTLKQFQSWEKQKALLCEELTSEKRKLPQLQHQLQQAKEYLDQLEARWKQEEKTKEEALMQASTERREHEQIEVSGRSKENAMKLKAEMDTHRYKGNVRKLEHQITQLRLQMGSSKIPALEWGTNGSDASCLWNGRKVEYKVPIDPNFLGFQELEEVQRERECVMCLTEEISVVFLPCAHQVICAGCNELHQKQGMSECPSCRTPIQRRICVRFC